MGVTSEGPAIVSTVDGVPLLGQKTMAASIPVVLPSDQSVNVTIGTVSASMDATATAAPPSYVEGTVNPFSQNLTGDLRVIAKQSGTWNVATVTAVTAITNALPAGANAIGNVGVAPRAAQLTVAAINFSASGDNTIIAAGAGAQTIKVYRMYLVVAGDTTITVKDGVITDGAATLNAGGSWVWDENGEPWSTGAAATAWKLNSSNAVQVTGRIYYLVS